MGLCCCTMLTCPIGLCAGPCVACCDSSEMRRATLRNIFLGMFALGFVALYLPLTVACALADHDSWKLWKGDGQCWSEASSMDGVWFLIGGVAGLLMGVGLAGAVTMAVCLRGPQLLPPSQPNMLVPMAPSLPGNKVLESAAPSGYTEMV